MSNRVTQGIRYRFERALAGLAVTCLVGFDAGCAAKNADYTPALHDAQSALEHGLEAWKSGAPTGIIPNSKPVVNVIDAGRKPGQKLDRFTVLGETRAVAAGRTFVVQLELSNPEERLKTQYIVVGIDPIWVFRQADYELLSHWEHHMPEPPREQPAKDATEKPGGVVP